MKQFSTFLYSTASSERHVIGHSCGVYCRTGTGITLPKRLAYCATLTHC